MKIKNASRANQGVHTVDGLRFIEPGQTLDLDIAPDYVDRVKKLPFLDIVVGASSDDTKAKVATKTKGKSDDTKADEDARSDDELRAAVTEKFGADGVADLDRAGLLDMLKADA